MVVLKPAGVLSAGNIGGRLISVDGISKSLFYTHDGALLQAGESDGRILQGRTEQSRGKNGYFWQDWIWIPAGKSRGYVCRVGNGEWMGMEGRRQKGSPSEATRCAR